MKFSELELICNGEMLSSSVDEIITNLSIDTRNLSIQKGAVFFAIEGDNHDGHEYLEEAFQKGVRLFVVEKNSVDLKEAGVIKVKSSIKALQKIVSHHRQRFDYPVIGITGSNGKTIVKEWLSLLLTRTYNVVKSPKSYNSQVGVPLSVWQMNSQHQVGIFEAGISKPNEMANLQEIIRPNIGVFTNIGEAHNVGFETKMQKAQEKALLFKDCSQIIYPIADPIIAQCLKENDKGNQKHLGWKVNTLDQNVYEVTIQKNSFKIKLKFNEPYFVENAIHCAVVMKVLGIDHEIIQKGLNNLPAVKMRLELKQAVGQSYLIDDTYNNDLHGLEVALDFLNRQNQKKNKSVILSDISQSGIEGPELYSKVNKLLIKNQVTRIVGIGKEIESNHSAIQISAEYYTDTDSFLKSNFKPNDEIILIKGARNFAFERIVERLEKNIHQTVLEINLENIIQNLNFYRSKLSSGTKVMAMVKAYAYGGGIFEIANLLQYHKVDYLGVAYSSEAIELRKHGIYVPIMIMNPSTDSLRYLAEYNLEPEIYSLDLLYEFITYFEESESAPGIHIKLESGMNRLGFTQKELPQMLQLLTRNKHIRVKSIFSHLAGSETLIHDSYSHQQAQVFTEMSDQICESLWYKPSRHIANTGGISRFPEYHFDMVRLGIGLYGFDPTEQEQSQLMPVGTLKSNVSQIKRISKGETVGYNRNGIAAKDMRIAIVPIGYADGYLRRFGNGKGYMLINGQRAYVFGNVCMDMTMLDITDLDCKTDDEVVIFGDEPTVKELADQIDTIPYEILTNIGSRVRRVFQSE